MDKVIVAGNGLLDRRTFLRGGAAFAAAITGYSLPARAEALKDEAWGLEPGGGSAPYEKRSRFQEKIARTLSNPHRETRAPPPRPPPHPLHRTPSPQPPPLTT